MRKTVSLVMALIMGLFGVGCNDASPLSANFLANQVVDKDLLGSWTRSFEEEEVGSAIEVYRPSESREFPPAWFRMRYVFHVDGACEWLVLHPTDAHFMTMGRWGVDRGDRAVVFVYDATGSLVKHASFRIDELTSEILRITRMSN